MDMTEAYWQLIDACGEKDFSLARRLIEQHNGVLDTQVYLGETALHFLAVEGYVEGVEFLIAAGANVNLPNEFGNTPLLECVLLKKYELVKVLLEAGADVNAASEAYGTPIDVATSGVFGDSAMAALLMKFGAGSP